jgi:hypothetical protein
MSLPIRFGGVKVKDLKALVDAAHVGAVGLAMGSAIRFLTTQDARVRGDTHNDVPMEPTMCGRLGPFMSTAMSRRPSAPDGDGDDNEPMWSLQFTSAWARLDATCDPRALAEPEPLITTVLAILPPIRPTVPRAGCVAETRSNNERTTRFLAACPRSYPFPRLPRISFQSYKPTSVIASTCFASPTSLPSFLTALSRTLGGLHLVSATAPLFFWLRTRLQRAT